MKKETPKVPNIFLKMIEDKKAIGKCIKEGGSLKELAKERGIKFVQPI